MNHVFSIYQTNKIDQSFHYQAKIDMYHSVFKGHFPDQPVVPGVCTMNMLKLCFADALGYAVRYDYIKECKFLSVIVPQEHQVLDVKFDFKTVEDKLNVIAEVSYNGNKAIKLKATLV